MSLGLKPTHATVKAYYETLHELGQLYIDHEGAVRSAFQTLLAKCGQKATPKLTLVPEYRIERARSSVVVDGALVDLYHLPHGYWEARDEQDDLDREVKLKLDKGYPRDNIIFQAPERAILYQGGARIIDQDISRSDSLGSGRQPVLRLQGSPHPGVGSRGERFLRTHSRTRRCGTFIREFPLR